ncbi:DUF881 domain-containing protein [Alkalihalobacillus sp. BA299]|uniref:DUF881 domain-containing protein n=1 Tax=Alkalihalobacillus sp. BA299 TaxID=2815938 RepID=UPI001ADD45F9|nr:DUF881 domain-containing protein [Alkalihalobacillus sp. BA299]
MSNRLIFMIVTLIIGFMVAIQFQSTKEPIVRDTRDIRELRKELRTEQDRHQQLVQEIEKHASLIDQYEVSLNDHKENVESVMEEQIDNLRKEAGLTEVSGEGIILTIEPLYHDQFFGHNRNSVSPVLLRFLVNELNFNGAKEIAIGNQRIISTTAFREVNGVTRVNNRRLPTLPIEIKVLADDAQKLHNEMVVSESVEYFEIDNLKLTSTPINYLEIPAFDDTPRVRYMEQVKED